MTTAPRLGRRPGRAGPRRDPRRSLGGRTALAAVVMAFAACADEPAADMTVADYTVALESICTATTVRLDALARPPEEVDVATFAAAVADALGDEADSARELAVPDERADDHRAFVRNTDEQSSGWSELAATPASDPAFGDLARTIGELTLGRNDLSTEMGLDACVRTAAETS